jgi:nucleoside-diphosphate-sugar epimerase
VGDLVKALLLAADSPGASRETMILGTGVETSVSQLFEEVSRQLAVSVRPKKADRVMGDIARMRYDCTKAQRILGWQATTSLAQGVDAVIRSLP